jgi:hypothetical protein
VCQHSLDDARQRAQLHDPQCQTFIAEIGRVHVQRPRAPFLEQHAQVVRKNA